jgi:hypothetical protein
MALSSASSLPPEEQTSYMDSREEELLVTSGFTEQGSHLVAVLAYGHG